MSPLVSTREFPPVRLASPRHCDFVAAGLSRRSARSLCKNLSVILSAHVLRPKACPEEPGNLNRRALMCACRARLLRRAVGFSNRMLEV